MKRFYIAGAVTGFIAGAAFIISAVLRSKGSTAVVGFLFIPFYGGIGAWVGVSLVYLLSAVRDFTKKELKPRKLISCVLIVVLYGYFAYAWRVRENALEKLKDPSLSSTEISSIYDQKIPMGRSNVTSAIASHPNTSPELLMTMVQTETPYVQMLIGQNPSAPRAALEIIGEGNPSYERHSGLAKNPKTPVAIFEKLVNVSAKDFKSDTEYHLYQTYVLGALARNPSLPRPLFQKLFEWEKPEYFLVYGIIQSPQVTCEELTKILSADNAVLVSTARATMKERGCK